MWRIASVTDGEDIAVEDIAAEVECRVSGRASIGSLESEVAF